MSKAIIFKNFTSDPFTWSWDGVAYTFQPGQEMYMEDYKAEHFAKHLVDQELNKTKTPTNNKTARQPFEKLALPLVEPITPEKAVDVEAKKESKVKAKGKKVVEEEFADLK